MKGKITVKNLQSKESFHTLYAFKERQRMYWKLRELYSLNVSEYTRIKNGLIQDGFEKIFRSIFRNIEKKSLMSLNEIQRYGNVPTENVLSPYKAAQKEYWNKRKQDLELYVNQGDVKDTLPSFLKE